MWRVVCIYYMPAIVEIVGGISDHHGYGYTCGFHTGFPMGTGMGMRIQTHEKPVPVVLPYLDFKNYNESDLNSGPFGSIIM